MAHNPITNFFASEHSSTLVCTSAGVIGGITKAVVTPHLLNITLDGSLSVASYAALSSIAAYLAKEAIGWVQKRVVAFASGRKQKGGTVSE